MFSSGISLAHEFKLSSLSFWFEVTIAINLALISPKIRAFVSAPLITIKQSIYNNKQEALKTINTIANKVTILAEESKSISDPKLSLTKARKFLEKLEKNKKKCVFTMVLLFK